MTNDNSPWTIKLSLSRPGGSKMNFEGQIPAEIKDALMRTLNAGLTNTNKTSEHNTPALPDERFPSDPEIFALAERITRRHAFTLNYRDLPKIARGLLEEFGGAVDSNHFPAPVNADPERDAWLASLYPEDRMFEDIEAMARTTFVHHQNSKRGQTVVRADSWEAHLIWATKRWIEENSPSLDLAQEHQETEHPHANAIRPK